MHAMIAATAGTECGPKDGSTAPVFVEAVEAVERASKDAGLPLCGVALDAARAAELAARGYRALLRGIDVFMLKEAIATFREPPTA
jgi:hypothetical protein